MDDFEQGGGAFHPEVGGRRGRERGERMPTFRRSLLSRIELRFRRVARVGSLGAVERGGAPAPSTRRCVVKARVVPLNARGVKAAQLHLRYIEREGVERDGSPGRLYGSNAEVAREELSDPLPGEKHQFRFIVSPEEGAELDLRQYTSALMAQVEADLGRNLVWAAVNHYDTDNPHAHVVVRGVDRGGRQVRIDPEYIAFGMRGRAEEIATRELGPRDRAALERQAEREVGQERLTRLDRELLRLADETGTIALGAMASLDLPRHRRLLGRLQTLERLRVAQRKKPGWWQLEPKWQATLRALGERGDVIKRIHAALDRRPAWIANIVNAKQDLDAPFEGLVRRKGLHDELGGDVYAVVEDAGGSAHYVRLDPATASQVKEGSLVRVTVERDTWVKPPDRAIAAVAAENAGVYDPSAHERSLGERRSAIRGRMVPTKEVLAVNVRRLERLARYRLAEPLPGGRWRVPPDLVSQLEAREKTHPRRSVRLRELASSLADAVVRRGPSWIDGCTESSTACHGFGAEVRRAMGERVRFLQDIGISAELSERLTALAELERCDVGRGVASSRSYEFVAKPSAMLTGVAEDAAHGYVAVVDDRKRQVAILRAAEVPRELRGKKVDLHPSGKVVGGLTR